jgi:hypothetical protein
MFTRLGHVLGWTANLFAILLLIGAAAELLGYVDSPPGNLLAAGIICAFALVIFLIGCALRYILVEPKSQQ